MGTPKNPGNTSVSAQTCIPSAARQAAVYARQSRTREGDMSLCDAQVDMCLDAARMRNWDVTGIFRDEGVSSETLERPELEKLIAAINAREIDRLVVYGIDRLTRRLAHLQILLELFEANAVELVVVNDPSHSDTPVSRLMTNIVATASTFKKRLVLSVLGLRPPRFSVWTQNLAFRCLRLFDDDGLA